MDHKHVLRCAVVIAMAASVPAMGRANPLMVPIAPVLAQAATQGALNGFPVRFGAPPLQQRAAAPDSEVNARSWARPHDTRGYGGPTSQLPDGRTVPLSKEQACQLALRYTLVALIEDARSRGAQSVVDIVSMDEEAENNSPAVFACRAANASSTVSLRGRLVGAAATGTAASTAPIASIASGFAAVADIDSVPYLGDKGREDYRAWIAQPTPKAFAISTTGHWFGASSVKPTDPAHPVDPVDRALLVCSQRSQAPCRLYAVNGSVVWSREVAGQAAAGLVPGAIQR